MKLDFRRLFPDEIQAKVKVETQTSVMLLLYKDARVDMAILDETVGKMNWQRHHEGINDNMYCVVDIWDTDKLCWVSKSDAGSESQTEKEKGESSDSFKRACVNWGIGRELYTAPPIWVDVSAIDYSNGQRRRLKTVFSVADIEYDDRGNITYLILEDQRGVKRFEYGKKTGKKPPQKKPPVTIPEDLTPVTRKPSGKPSKNITPPIAPPDYDPATASMEEVAGVVDRVFNPQKTPIRKGLFTIKRGWNSILELCGGDVEFAKGIFGQFGAETSDKITYEIYLDVFNALNTKPGENTGGPEEFVDDEIPFGYEPQGEIS